MSNDEAPSVPRNQPELELSDIPFAVVGIGASAGGLSALTRFFENMPDDNGMAFCVILHLSPTHESDAAAILQRVTSMHVSQVVGTVPIEPDHVYVIAPGYQLLMNDGRLYVGEIERPKGKRIAIDLFFRSLADVHRENAFGVVLSGTGADGSIGIARIKEQGGVAFAQTPEDCEFDGMPSNAITTGMIDFVLAADELPQKVFEVWSNARSIRLPDSMAHDAPDAARDGDTTADAEAALHEVIGLLRHRTGHDFRSYKRATVLRRIERRMQVHCLPDLPRYRDHLRAHAEETTALLQDMLIGVTNFFRDRETFEALERTVIPELFAQKRSDEAVRAWTAGCATGEEAYSLAMLLDEQAQKIEHGPSTHVFATDIDSRAIGLARAGTYPEAIVTDVPAHRLRQYFTSEQGRFRVKKSLRDTVLFALHNLLRDPPFSQLDLISCRNLLIYLDRDVQVRILEMFHFALQPGGYLVLGGSESAESVPKYFTPVDKRNRIYRANAVPRSVWYSTSSGGGATAFEAEAGVQSIRARRTFSFSEVHRRALETVVPPSVIVDAEGRVVYVAESATRFLRHVAGEPTQAMAQLVLPELRLELRAAMLEAAQNGSVVVTRPVELDVGDRRSRVGITVRPFRDPVVAAEFLVVVFEESVADPARSESVARTDDADGVIVRLERELDRTRQHLQQIVEQAETSNEELRASNEELQAINEELRSATEELETSKEEVQSVNEELTTVNSELKMRVEETSKGNDDLRNFIAAADIALVFVDKALRIKRYTPRALDIFNLIPTDVGRPLVDITHRLDYPLLAQDTSAVLDAWRVVEREVRGVEGRYYFARLIPYRTTDNRIDGIVLTFIDITGRRQAEELLRIGEEQMRLVGRRSLETELAHEWSRSEDARTENSQKDEFLAVLSHELKHPLNLIQMQVEVLRRLPELRDSTKASGALSKVKRSVQSQAKIIDDLLDLSRVRTGKLSLERRPVDLGAMAKDLIGEFEGTSQAVVHVISLSLAEDTVIVDADPVRLEQVLHNLLGNARKFTPVGGSIAIRVGTDGSDGFVEIVDSGQGIEPRDLPRIFEMFGQAERGTTRSRGGLGIGLALVKQLVELHGGSIAIESAGPGQGTSVLVHIPRYVAPEDSRRRSSSPASASTSPFRGARMLIVDDSRDTLDSFEMLLSMEGAIVRTAESAHAAFTVLAEAELDVLVSDLGMPDVDGHELIRTVRRGARNKDVLAIAVSGYNQPEDVRRSLESGFDAHLPKPLLLESLASTLVRLRAR